MKRVSGISALLPDYDALLLDVWGVLHDGRCCYPGALECLKRLAQRQCPVLLLSNAARRQATLRQELAELGIDAGLYHSLLSSGELAWQALADAAPGLPLREPVYYLGPERSRGLCNGLELSWTDNPAAAGLILNAGAPGGNPANTDALMPLLSDFCSRKIPMLCANPDQFAVRAGELGIAAGAIARAYRRLGAESILYFGKPEAQIFQLALQALPGVDRSRILMVGDGVETDIIGACGAGLDSLLITGGIHAAEIPDQEVATITRFSAEFGVQARFYCDGLRW